MKLRLKIISRNLYKSDQINYMHIHHKCSLSMTIPSHTGNPPKMSILRQKSIGRKFNFSNINTPELRFIEKSKIRLVEKLIYRKHCPIEFQKIFLVGTKLWLTAKNSVKWLIWVKLFWFPISLSIMQNMMSLCNFEWFPTCFPVANMNAPGNFCCTQPARVSATDSPP